MRASIVGGSGYVGGELLRLLLRHPRIELEQVSSDSMAGKAVTRAHPNLRRSTDLRFVPHSELKPAEVTFVAVPHRESMHRMPDWLARGGLVVDLSADHRLKDPSLYPQYYGVTHPHPELLVRSVYGLPELHREEIRGSSLISNPGCIAAATILALRPLVAAGLVDTDRPVVVDAKSGSSAGGSDSGPASSHPERSGSMRMYSPAGHRHTAEIEQETGAKIGMSAHAVEAVRGVLSTSHAFLRAPVEEKEVWKVYRTAYGSEPFIRIVHEPDGIHREPEPKILCGSNYCDIGFAVDAHTDRLIAISAIDNLMKGAAGNALQALNLAAGFPETMGLEFSGLHPI
ncbi:MAG: N-acetyl-gamma-glutamyl-phosphate reductase [Thermoplasmata archaeon]